MFPGAFLESCQLLQWLSVEKNVAVEMLPLSMHYIQIKALESDRTRKEGRGGRWGSKGEQIIKDSSVIPGSYDLSLQSTTDKAD